MGAGDSAPVWTPVWTMPLDLKYGGGDGVASHTVRVWKEGFTVGFMGPSRTVLNLVDVGCMFHGFRAIESELLFTSGSAYCK